MRDRKIQGQSHKAFQISTACLLVVRTIVRTILRSIFVYVVLCFAHPAAAYRTLDEKTPLGYGTRDNVVQMLSRMTLEEKIGQMLMVGIPAGWTGKNSNILGNIKVGGVILFKRNISSKAQLKNLTAKLQNMAKQSETLPLFIAIDHEGGRVNRLPRNGFTAFPFPLYISKTGDIEKVKTMGKVMARELLSVGIHINLAPVVDVISNSASSIIGNRSFGQDPAVVSLFASAFIQEAQQNGLLTVAKHFPGYGPVAKDPHNYLPFVNISYGQWQNTHLPPFLSAMQAGVDGIMSAHVVYPALDESKTPASLSKTILTGLLRTQLAYNGLILTDDMEMGAIGKHYGIGQAAIQAVLAGNDMLLICHSPAKQRKVFHSLLGAAGKGLIPMSRIDESMSRILEAKLRYRVWKN